MLCVHTKRDLSLLELVKNIIPSLVIVVICGWLILIILIYILRYQVLYTDSHISKNYYEKIQAQEEQFENVNIVTADHINLQGYLYRKQRNEKTPLVIYFGGRGEEATNIAEYATKIESGWALAFINYRGCGSSTGKQDSQRMFSDAAFIYDYFANRDDIDNENIVIVSHSLGTGIAINLASQRDIKGIILSCPYDKYVAGVIQDKLPLIPIKLLVKEEYDSLSVVQKLKNQVLFLLAENDKTVVRSRSMKLFNHWGSKNKKISIIKDTNHETITFHDLTWSNINAFLDNIPAK
jgi:alpha-beta hydrolase superfamily lysophospholipase